MPQKTVVMPNEKDAPQFLTAKSNSFPINARHSHTVYMSSPDKGKSTKNKGHQHEIGMIEQPPTMIPMPMQGPVDPVAPPMPPQMMAQPTPPKMGVMPAGDDMHTHELTDLVIPDEKNDEPTADEKEEVHQVFKFRTQAQTFDLESREKAYDDEKYLTEDQWSTKAKKEMSDTDRAAITANTIKPKIDVLSGYQRSNRTDFKFYPVEEGDQIGADISNELSKITCERINYWQEESRAFLQQISVGRGFLYGYIDYEEDDRGFPKIKFVDYAKVNTGPHFEIDGSDLEFFTIDDIFSKEKVIAMYPDKKDRIEALMKGGTSENLSNYVTAPDSTNPLYWDRSVVNKLNKTITIVELQRYEYETKYIFVDENNPDATVNITGMPQKMIDNLKTIDGVKIITKANRKIRMTKVAGDILLEDEYPKTLTNEFSLWPIYAEKNRDKWAGKVRFVKDLADLNNKNVSSIADILNKMNNFIWYIKKNMFDTPKEMKDFIENSAKPGFKCILADDSTEKPSREQGVQYPAQLENAIRLTQQLIEGIMNVNTELMGGQTNAQSGVQEDQRRKAAVLGNEFLFDNLSMSKKRIGKWLLAVFQVVFGPERIARLLNNYDQRQPVKIGGERFDKDTIMGFLKNVDFTNYDVIISETSMNVSRRMGVLQQLLQMEQSAPGSIPKQLIMKYMDLTDEDRSQAMEIIKSQMEQEQQMEQAKQKAEENKTLMAAQGKMATEQIKQQNKQGGF